MGVRKIAGTLAALGPSRAWGPSKGSEAGSSMYGYVRIDGEDGSGYVLENVVARRQVDAYIRLGLVADYYLVDVRQKALVHLLVAISSSSCKASDIEVADLMRGGMKTGSNFKLFIGLCNVIIGAILLVFIIGIPFLLYGSLLIYQGIRLRSIQVATTADVKQELAAMGVVT
jgi:hypothetical protein